MVFGPWNALPGREQRMFSRMRLGRPILVPGDGTTLGVVGHVDDQSRAIETMMGMEATFGKRFNLTGADPHSDTVMSRSSRPASAATRPAARSSTSRSR